MKFITIFELLRQKQVQQKRIHGLDSLKEEGEWESI